MPPADIVLRRAVRHVLPVLRDRWDHTGTDREHAYLTLLIAADHGTGSQLRAAADDAVRVASWDWHPRTSQQQYAIDWLTDVVAVDQ